jgi:YggT family protein
MTILSLVVTLLFYVLELAIVVRVLLSWINVSPDHPIAHLLVQITEPILGPLRSRLPLIGMFDISPIVAILLLDLARRLLLLLLSLVRL